MKMNKIVALLLAAVSTSALAQIPLLNSNPTITNRVIYLDFDGQKVVGTSWNNGNLINASASTLLNSANGVRQVWNRISEDYRPFDVNVTTDSVRFNNASPTARIRVVFTTTSSWFTQPAGGVAFLNSFTWGGYPGTPCWVFENQLGSSLKNYAEAASHEVGHTLSLRHQSTYDVACNQTNEYNPGQGSGVTSWAPIMGVGYNDNVTIWHNGPNATGCTTLQPDHNGGVPGITGPGFLNYLPDDVGNTVASAKILNLTTLNTIDSGLITTPTDIDVYRFDICNSRYVSLNIRPWALDSTPGSYQGANLDVKLKLYNAAGTLLLGDSTITRLNALRGITLAAGSYYFVIDGDGSTNYTDYGSLGKYYLWVKATNPPQLANSIILPGSVCSGQNTTLNFTSNGTPTNWQWNISGPQSGSFSIANPAFSFNSPGVYTISLLATSGSSASCVTTRTVNAGSLPVLNLAGTGTVLCSSSQAVLSASGANSYTWLPGNSSISSILVNPTIATTYTLLGRNGNCVNTVVSTLSVGTAFNVNLLTSNSVVCSGSSATLSANGAASYTFNPGGITSNPAIVSPLINTTYTVTGLLNGCRKTSSRAITVRSANFVGASASNTIVCPGEEVTLSFSGANNYTVQPGNLSGNPVLVNPGSSIIYTITGTDIYQCQSSATVEIELAICSQTSLRENETAALIKIYPNPAHSEFVVQSSILINKMDVYTMQGQLIYSANPSKTNAVVNVSNWNKGIYFLKLQDNGGTVTRKIIIE